MAKETLAKTALHVEKYLGVTGLKARNLSIHFYPWDVEGLLVLKPGSLSYLESTRIQSVPPTPDPLTYLPLWPRSLLFSFCETIPYKPR